MLKNLINTKRYFSLLPLIELKKNNALYLNRTGLLQIGV